MRLTNCEGRAIKLEGLVSVKGNEYATTIQINAERWGIEDIFENDTLFNAEKLGDVKLRVTVVIKTIISYAGT